MSSADKLSTSSRRVGVFLFVCVFLSFFMPTQRGRLKWTDYSSHERQHNSRVTFEPYRDKKKKRKWVQSSAEVVQPRWGKFYCYKDNCCCSNLLFHCWRTPTTSRSNALWYTRILLFSTVSRPGPQQTLLFFSLFFTIINLYHSCLSKKKQKNTFKS